MTTLSRSLLVTALTLGAAAIPAAAQNTEAKRTLTLSGAKAIGMAAEAEAKRLGAGGAIAVVDDGGHLLYLVRIDGTFSAAANIAAEKARSAAAFRRETAVFEDAIKNGRTSLVANKELLPLQGGVPVIVEGQVVGAVGVAGAQSAKQDVDIANVAALSLR